MDQHKLFNQDSALYAESRPHYPADLFAYLAGICAERKTAWDGACGNGQAAVSLVPFVGQI